MVTWLKSLFLNVALSFLAVVVCMVAMGLLSHLYNVVHSPSAAAFVAGTRNSVDPSALKRYYAVHDLFLGIGAVMGIASAQVIWVLRFRLDRLEAKGRQGVESNIGRV